MFDATEIDEILTLRVMTLTDEEKAAARGTDPRAAAIIDRCDSMPAEVLERLHGARREPPPASDRPVWTAVPTYAEPGRDGPGGAARTWRPGPRGPEPAVPWWDPAADASASPETDTVLVGGVPVAKGSRVRLRRAVTPTRRTCSWPARSPSSPRAVRCGRWQPRRGRVG